MKVFVVLIKDKPAVDNPVDCVAVRLKEESAQEFANFIRKNLEEAKLNHMIDVRIEQCEATL